MVAMGDPVILELVKRLQVLTALVLHQQPHIFALEAYLEQQPGYDAGLYAEFLQRYRENATEQIARERQSANSALLAVLAGFDAPPQ